MDPLWASLLNSDWHDHRGTGAREDRIGNDEWLGKFLDRTGWPQVSLPSDREREALRGLRRRLRRFIDTYRQDGAMDPGDLETLNRILEAAPVIRRLDQNGILSVVPAVRGIQSVLAEIVASLADMLARGEYSRVKICANPDCGWVIYDESRNQTRRWCSATDCGNLMKVRKHRRKRRDDKPV